MAFPGVTRYSAAIRGLVRLAGLIVLLAGCASPQVRTPLPPLQSSPSKVIVAGPLGPPEPVQGELSSEQVERFEAVRAKALGGNPEDQLELGLHYHEGWGVRQDDVQAAIWYRKAADQGLARAQGLVGWCYLFGRGVPKDFVTSAAWQRKAAEQGDVQACLMLARAHRTGQGVVRDVGLAMGWIRRAAEAGSADAMVALASCYADGYGVERDDAESLRWLRRAAELGFPIAKLGLAVHYIEGRGVEVDKSRGLALLREAADAGYWHAQERLAGIYAAGDLAPRDEVEALALLLLAARQHPNEVGGALGALRAGMDAEAQRRAEARYRALAARTPLGPDHFLVALYRIDELR